MQKIFITLPEICIQRGYDTVEINILEKWIKKVINDDEDFVCIVKLMNDNVFGEEVLGNAAHETGEDLII